MAVLEVTLKIESVNISNVFQRVYIPNECSGTVDNVRPLYQCTYVGQAHGYQYDKAVAFDDAFSIYHILQQFTLKLPRVLYAIPFFQLILLENMTN